jgi:hypothetical protein
LFSRRADRIFQQGFEFGVTFAEYMHDIPFDRKKARFAAMFKTLQDIADGELTVVDTPEEFGAGKEYDDDAMRTLPAQLNAIRASTRAAARRVAGVYRKKLGDAFFQ